MAEERRVAAWIGPSLVIRGDLISSEDVTIAGQVEGNVTVEGHAVTIAGRASVRGDIVARAVAVHGEVIGTITSKGKVEIGETGSVDGDIRAQGMVVTEGAALRGGVKISTPAP